MATKIVEKDTLTHVNPENSAQNQAKLTSGCFQIFDEFGVSLELCYDIQGDEVSVGLSLSAFGKNVELGKATLTVGQTTTISGHIDSVAKAEVEISFNASPLSLCFDAKVCAKPFIGSWHCASTGKHCINV